MKARPIPAVPTKPEVFTTQNTDVEKKNMEVGKSAYAAMEGKGDLKAFLATMDEKVDWDDMTQPATMKGRGEAEKWFKMMHAGFSDGKMAMKNAWAFGDYMVVEAEFTGTHTGEFMGAKPTKKAVTFHGLDIIQAKDGKAVHGWWYANGAEAAMALGMMKPPGEAPKADPKAADPKAAPKADAPKADPKAAPKK
jgi:predicted ester cyclase